MSQIFQKPIPVGMFFIVIVLVCIGYGVSFYRQGEHFQKMEEFMNKGDRFTGAQGRDHDARLVKLEAEVKELKDAR